MTIRVSILSAFILFSSFALLAQSEDKKTKSSNNFSELPSNWSIELSTYPLVQFIHYDQASAFTDLISRSNDLEIKYRTNKTALLTDVLSFGVKADYDNLRDWDRMSYNVGYGKELHIGFYRLHFSAGAKGLVNATTFDKIQRAYSLQALGYGVLDVFLGKRVTLSAHYNYLGSVNLAMVKEIADEVINKQSNLGAHFNKSYYFKLSFYL
jgi:hypothetical protein